MEAGLHFLVGRLERDREESLLQHILSKDTQRDPPSPLRLPLLNVYNLPKQHH